MTGQQILDQFRLEVDNQDDLSDSEALQLANDVLSDIYNDRDWAFLMKTASGTLDTTNTEISLPSDFRELADNFDDQESVIKKVLYVGTNYEPYPFIQMTERRQYRDQRGFVYIDYRQNNFVLTAAEQADSRSYEFEYIYIPSDISLLTSPILPARFHKMVAFGMAVKWNDIDGTDKSFSYRAENAFKFEQEMIKLSQQDAKQKSVNL